MIDGVTEDSGLIKVPFKNEMTTYYKLKFSISNEKKIEQLEEMLPILGYVNLVFEKMNNFLVKFCNIAKCMTSIYIDTVNIIDFGFIRKITEVCKVLDKWNLFISQRDNTYQKPRHKKLSKDLTRHI